MMQIFGIFTTQLILFTLIGETFGAKSGRENTKDKMRQYEKNQMKQDGKKINNTSQKFPHPEITSLPDGK
jgi:hypothetical protein